MEVSDCNEDEIGVYDVVHGCGECGAVKWQGAKEHHSVRICDDLRLLAAIKTKL